MVIAGSTRRNISIIHNRLLLLAMRHENCLGAKVGVGKRKRRHGTVPKPELLGQSRPCASRFTPRVDNTFDCTSHTRYQPHALQTSR
jgi:hypothetical protein